LGLGASIAPEGRHDGQEENGIVVPTALDDDGVDRRDIHKLLKLMKYSAPQFCLGIIGEVGRSGGWSEIRQRQLACSSRGYFSKPLRNSGSLGSGHDGISPLKTGSAGWKLAVTAERPLPHEAEV
jgi:hypothetical protein